VIAMSKPLHGCCPPDAHGVVSIRGEIDGSCADLIGQLAGLPDPVLLDLTQVEFIDCSGLAILLGEQRRRGVAFRVVAAASRTVDRLLEVARLELTTAPVLESVS
jgi:anti-anti-sigma factor